MQQIHGLGQRRPNGKQWIFDFLEGVAALLVVRMAAVKQRDQGSSVDEKGAHDLSQINSRASRFTART
jgi:hypothetical protein